MRHIIARRIQLRDQSRDHILFLIPRDGQHNLMKFASQLFGQAHTKETTKVFWIHPTVVNIMDLGGPLLAHWTSNMELRQAVAAW